MSPSSSNRISREGWWRAKHLDIYLRHSSCIVDVHHCPVSYIHHPSSAWPSSWSFFGYASFYDGHFKGIPFLSRDMSVVTDILIFLSVLEFVFLENLLLYYLLIQDRWSLYKCTLYEAVAQPRGLGLRSPLPRQKKKWRKKLNNYFMQQMQHNAPNRRYVFKFFW